MRKRFYVSVKVSFLIVLLSLGQRAADAQHAGPPTAPPAAPSGALRERKNIQALEPDSSELKAYMHAVDVLQKSTDATKNYQFYADLHDEFAPNHGCEHGNELFFPWHRSLLYYYEQALRAADHDGTSGPSTKDVALPYWDWTSPPSGVRYPAAFEDPASPLFDQRNTSPTSTPFYPKATIFGVINATTTWPGFAGGPKSSPFPGALEQPYHNDMHSVFIGGDMGFPDFAALDPMFWSFHAYIDLLWDRWQKIYHIDPTCLDCPLRGLPAEKTAKDLIDVEEQLGYFYTENAGLADRLAMAPAAAPLLAAQRPAGEPKVFELLPAGAPENLAPPQAAPGEGRDFSGAGPFSFKIEVPRPGTYGTAHLLLAGVKVPTTLSYGGTVYLHPAEVPIDPSKPESRRYAAGSISVWVGHAQAGEHEAHAERRGLYTNITKALQALPADAAGKDYELTLAFRVVPLPKRRNAAAVNPLPAAEEIRFRAVRLVLDTQYEAKERTLEPVAPPAEAPAGPPAAAPAAPPAAAAAPAPRTPYFELHIRPMMRLLDRESMVTVAGLDLWDYDQVRAAADRIITHLRSDMPPGVYGGPWPEEWITLFGRWKDADFPRLSYASLNPTPAITAQWSSSGGSFVVIKGFAHVDNGNDKAWLQPVIEEGKPRSYVLYREPDTSGMPAPGHNVRLQATFGAPATLTSVTVRDAAGDHEITITGDPPAPPMATRMARGAPAPATGHKAQAMAMPATEEGDAQARLLDATGRFFRERLSRSAPAPVSSAQAAVEPLRAPHRLDLALSSPTDFIEPDEIASDPNTKILNATLTVAYAANTIGSDAVYLRNYNGKLVGPTLRARPGDTLRIKLVNNLPPEPGPQGHSGFHGFNTTNLHTHGLHVDPKGNSDNVLLAIAPGTEFDYEIAIPADHPSGTFWYHAHKHGSVAAHLASGMAGMLIIEGTQLDGVEAIKKAAQKVFVFQQIPYVFDAEIGAGVVERKYVDRMFSPNTWDASGHFTTINGQILPVLKIKPGEVQRWRFVHGGLRESILPKLMKVGQNGTLTAGPQMSQIALDGLPLGKVQEVDAVELQPGYRSDVLVQFPEPGTYVLVDERLAASKTLLGIAEDRKYLARVEVEGDDAGMSLPSDNDVQAFRLPSIAPASVDGQQTALYTIDLSTNPITFKVDGVVYDDNNPPHTLKLGKTDAWTIRGTVANHPFHIHVNPFEIYSIVAADGTQLLTEPVWRDTILMPAGGVVKFRTRYDVFTGKFVQHCHILDHEDQGMMQKLEIIP
jgi:FtsP/CotA-like multicopper oxidase with cupredoxin domain